MHYEQMDRTKQLVEKSCMRLTTIRRSSLEVFYKKRYSQRFRIIHRKTPEPEDNFLKTSFSKNTAGGFHCITSYVIHRRLKKRQYVIAQNANLLSIFREEADQFGWGRVRKMFYIYLKTLKVTIVREYLWFVAVLQLNVGFTMFIYQT